MPWRRQTMTTQLTSKPTPRQPGGHKEEAQRPAGSGAAVEPAEPAPEVLARNERPVITEAQHRAALEETPEQALAAAEASAPRSFARAVAEAKQPRLQYPAGREQLELLEMEEKRREGEERARERAEIDARIAEAAKPENAA